MGDCASRPTENEIQHHVKLENSKNNRHFKLIPHSARHSEFILLENNLSKLESRKSIYLKKYFELLKEKHSASPPNQLKEIIIEVQKGLCLDKPGLCFLQGKPFVAISLEPNGPCYETFPTDLFKPIWYRVFQIKTLIEYTHIRVSVKINESSEVVGSILIMLSQLKDQKIRDQWYPLKNSSSHKPSLKLRIQYIENEEKLYKDLIEQCEIYIKDINESIEKLQV